MTEKQKVVITGAESGVGEQLALALSDTPEFDIHLVGGLSMKKLEEVAIACGAVDCFSGDLFNPEASNYVGKEVLKIRADIIANIAAVNLDNVPWSDRLFHKQDQSRELQNEYVRAVLRRMQTEIAESARLLIHVDSMYGIWGEALPIAARMFSPYTRMKAEQKEMCDQARESIERIGNEISVTYPGAIQTFFGGRHSPKDVQKWINIAGRFMKWSEKRQQWVYSALPQLKPKFRNTEILEKEEVGQALARQVKYFLKHGKIPEDTKNWIMSCHADCKKESLNMENVSPPHASHRPSSEHLPMGDDVKKLVI